MNGELDKAAVPIAQLITEDFSSGMLDLSQRRGAPVPGWSALPECAAVVRITQAGATPSQIRTFLTLIATLDWARDADRLWACGVRLFLSHPWAFTPTEIVRRPVSELAVALKVAGVSQRHTKDTAAWRTIAESLLEVILMLHLIRTSTVRHGESQPETFQRLAHRQAMAGSDDET